MLCGTPASSRHNDDQSCDRELGDACDNERMSDAEPPDVGEEPEAGPRVVGRK